MYLLDDVSYTVARTYTFEAIERFDPRDGRACVELKSANGKYSLNLFADELEFLDKLEEEKAS